MPELAKLSFKFVFRILNLVTITIIIFRELEVIPDLVMSSALHLHVDWTR